MCPLTAQATLSSVDSGAMSETVWIGVRDAAAHIGEVIVAGFGEALVSVDCLPRLHELDALGVRIGITTNGTPLTRAVSAQLAALRHLVHVNISIDSPDPAVYRNIRGGELGKALQGAQNIVRAMHDPRTVTVSSLLMGDSVASLEDFPAQLASLGVRKWILQGLIDYSPRSRGVDLGKVAGADAIVERIREAAAQSGVEVVFTLPLRLEEDLRDARRRRWHRLGESFRASDAGTRQCCLPWELPYIDKDGRVFPCCFAATRADAVLGDVRISSIDSIWEGERYQKFRLDLLDASTMPSVCRTCTLAPTGEHPLRRFSAQIVLEESKLQDPTRIVVVARNTGSEIWTLDSGIHVATSNPRDRESALFHESWLSGNRTASFAEPFVRPGATATFVFRIADRETSQVETFELVADGAAWIPGTRFEVAPKPQAVVASYEATLEEGIQFTRPGYPQFIHAVRGFSHDEAVGRWTEGQEVLLRFATPLPRHFVFRMETVRAFESVAGLPLRVKVGDWQGAAVMEAGPWRIDLDVRTVDPSQTIEITVPNPASPFDLGISADGRKLGVMFERISLVTPVPVT